MIDVLQLFLFCFFILFLFSITFLYFDSRIKYRKLLAGYAANQIEKEYFKKKLAEQISNKESKRVEQTDGFLKFVSESRDWAFQYIENVQKVLKEFEDVFASAALSYELNKVMPSNDEFEKIIEAYKKMSKELPKED